MALSESTLTYEDLASFPEDNFRRELIGGELIVTAAPSIRHQRVVGNIYALLRAHAEERGGEAFVAPTDVFLSDIDVVEPDVLYIAAEHVSRIEESFIRGTPDLVVEISSPSTRRLELVRKRELYLRYEVPEYWYVDLDADEIYVDRYVEGRYETTTFGSGAALRSQVLEGFEAAVDHVLGDG